MQSIGTKIQIIQTLCFGYVQCAIKSLLSINQSEKYLKLQNDIKYISKFQKICNAQYCITVSNINICFQRRVKTLKTVSWTVLGCSKHDDISTKAVIKINFIIIR